MVHMWGKYHVKRASAYLLPIPGSMVSSWQEYLYRGHWANTAHPGLTTPSALGVLVINHTSHFMSAGSWLRPHIGDELRAQLGSVTVYLVSQEKHSPYLQLP